MNIPVFASETITDATALSALCGLGTAEWQWSNLSGHTVWYFANSGVMYTYSVTLPSSQVSITYDYTAAPEPSAVGLLVAAGILLTGCRSPRWRRRIKDK